MSLDCVTLFDDRTLLDEGQLQLQASVRKFAEERARPIAEEYFWQEKQVPGWLLAEMGRLGFMGVSVPEDAGGSGFGTLESAVVAEELSRGWSALPDFVLRAVLFAHVLLQYGTEAQKKKYVRGMCSGELLPASAGTESDAGSDAANMKTTAVKERGHYVLNGSKMFCSFANRSHVLFTYCMTDLKAKPKYRGVSCFAIDKEPGDKYDPPGLTGKKIPLIGYHGNSAFELYYQDYRVPEENLIGGEGGLNRGWYQLMLMYERGRVGMAAHALGVARTAFEEAVRYAQNRVQFGHAISNYQAQRFRIAEMATDIAAAKQLIYLVARKVDCGQKCTMEASMAKLLASEVAVRVTDAAQRIFAGYGYAKSRVAMELLSARFPIIVEGTSDIQKRIIADELLGKPIIPQ